MKVWPCHRLFTRLYTVSAYAFAVTALTARLFSAWTMLSAIIRTTAAYHITDPTCDLFTIVWVIAEPSRVYNLVISTYLVAGVHFTSEYLIFKTVKLGRASLSVYSFASA